MHEGDVEICPISTLLLNRIVDVFLLECLRFLEKRSSCNIGIMGLVNENVQISFVLEVDV